jgi:hypothetical protein
MSDIVAPEAEIQRLTEQLTAIAGENELLREDMSQVMAQLAFEDAGWLNVFRLASGELIEGLSLEQVQEASEKIRPYLAGTGLIKRGSDLRTGYIWSKGVHIAGTERAQRAGRPSTLSAFFRNPVNQAALFSTAAQGELERAAYSDGNVFLIADRAARTVRRVPVSEITAIAVNPDYPDEVWRVQRTWNPDPSDKKPQVRWYYTNAYTGSKQRTITTAGAPVEVAPQTVISIGFNRQVGWALGVPDALASMPHYEAYRTLVAKGRTVSEGMASIIFKMTNAKSAAGAKNSAVKFNSMSDQAAQAASLTGGQDINVLSSAGKGYDFSSLRPIAAEIAAPLNVSVVELLADSSAAGSSYGAAQTLTPSTMNAMRMRQDEWKALYFEVFRFFDLDVAEIEFPDIVEPDAYREMQRLALAWGLGAIYPDEVRPEALKMLKIPSKHVTPPEGILIPNNETSLARKDIDTDGTGAPKQAAAPDQGQSNGSGGNAGVSNDLRRDVLSNAFTGMQLDEMTALVERFEAVAAKLNS